jgi:hypothetical protein
LLIDVYFPSLRPDYDKVIEARTKLNRIEGAFKRSYESGDIDGEPFLKPFVAAQLSIEGCGLAFQQSNSSGAPVDFTGQILPNRLSYGG